MKITYVEMPEADDLPGVVEYLLETVSFRVGYQVELATVIPIEGRRHMHVGFRPKDTEANY